MARLIRFLRYPVAEQWILVQVSLLLIMIRIGLLFLPFRTLYRFIQRIAANEVECNLPASDLYQRRVIWAINRAGAPILRDSVCLTQALAGKILLGRRGFPTKLRIGVQKDGQNKFQAHAWLESDGQVLIGGAGAELVRYTVLPDLDGIRT